MASSVITGALVQQAAATAVSAADMDQNQMNHIADISMSLLKSASNHVNKKLSCYRLKTLRQDNQCCHG